jgi:peroxiredoxin (alkyl hydroperoxide reductase subunit C)
MKGVEVMFPVSSDLTMEVARKYGMLQPSASTTQAVRAPLSNGRNAEEIRRLLVAMQHTDE